jgi:uncharacterized protein YndB with AHSA1/START domain
MNHEAEPNDAAESIIVECDLAEPPAKVWRALTEPALLASWLMPNDIRPEVGAHFTFQAEADAGSDIIACEVLAAEPPHLLRYSWRGDDANRHAPDRVLDSVVTFVLTETANGGTHLRLVHDGFPIGALQSVACLARAPSKVTDLEVARAHRRARLPLPIIANEPTQGSLRWAA